MNFIHSTLDKLRDTYAPISHTSTFRKTGEITPEEFLQAGDFLVSKFPTWSWSDAATPKHRAAYLPNDKQYLVTKGVPCHRRLDENFAGDAGNEETVGEDGWLQTGGDKAPGRDSGVVRGEVRTLDGDGEAQVMDDEDEIPDMEDEDDDADAIIKDKSRDAPGKTNQPFRTYTLYITYTPYYRTPRMYMQGFHANSSQPLPPAEMMEDIVGDYKDKTVTLEDFPFFEPSESIKLASVHPCRHASVMKVLLDRADAALKLRQERIAKGQSKKVDSGMEGLVDETAKLNLKDGSGHKAGVAAAGGAGGDEWEVLEGEGATGEDESAIRVDQYLVVFLKFAATLIPGVEHDFTTSV